MDQERERRLRLFFESEGVPLFGRLDIADCTFTYRELAERKAPFAQSVLLYAVPYYIGEPPERNLYMCWRPIIICFSRVFTPGSSPFWKNCFRGTDLQDSWIILQ